MKASKQAAQFILDFSDIEDLTDESSESQISIHPQPTPLPPPPPPPVQQVQSILQVKREGVEMPQIAIENVEEAPQKRKIDVQDQYWQINFEDLDEQDQGPDLPSPEPILINKEPSPPPVHIEEPQYIEQYFEDQNIIEEIEHGEIQKQNRVREQNKKDLIQKEQKLFHQPEPKVFPEVQQFNRVVSRQKFYNPKNSLLYLRLKGREDLYKKLDIIPEDPTQKAQEKDDLLEGLDCINNLLLDLSSVKEKQIPLEKQKPIPLQIQKHRLNERGEHHKERKLQKKVEPAELEIIEKEKQDKLKAKEAKQAESAMKQQQQQEAAQARQIRHEQLQQQKQLLKLLNQRQVYRITTKKLVSSGMALYRCCLKEKQRDFVQWLRFSEIALINKGEDEIFIFEKRLSDYFFMNANKKTITSVRITKTTVFDKTVIPYKEDQNKEDQVQNSRKKGRKDWTEKEELKNEKEDRYRSRERNKNKEIEDEKSQERETKRQKDRKRNQRGEQKNKEDEDFDIPKKERQSQRKREQNNSIEKSQEQIDTIITKENAQLDQKKGKVRCLESDDEDENDLLDADRIKIFKVFHENKKRIEKKDVKQEPEEAKIQQQDNEINQNTKKSKFHKFRQQAIVLSRLETNDKIKKLQKINEKRKEKRQKEYIQQLLLDQQAEEQELKKKQQEKEDKKKNNNKVTRKEKNQQNNNSSLERQNKKSEPQSKQKTDSSKSTQNGKNKKDQQKKNVPKMTTRSTRVHNTRSGGTSSVSRSLQRATEVEPGYISTKRVYENQKLNKRKRRIIEDEDFEASPEMKKAQPSKQLRKK